MSVERKSADVLKPTHEQGKALARQIFHQVMEAIDLRRAMLRKLRRDSEGLVAGEAYVPLARLPHVVAFGKAAGRMTAVLVEILGGHVGGGIIVTPAVPSAQLKGFRYFLGGHPYPNSASLAGAAAVLELVTPLETGDLVIFLVSGGGSALFEKPFDPDVSLDDLIDFNRVLVTCGLPIEQINVLRKHVSAVKGGRLAKAAYPARQLTIFVSDVPAGLGSMVASGPTMPDDSTLEECYRLAQDHELVPRFPMAIRRLFDERRLEETPKADDPCFGNSQYLCLLSNQEAVAAAKEAAERQGFISAIDPNDGDADYRNVADQNLESLNALARRYPEQPVALIVGGEVTCAVTGSGMGGRNQAYVLYAAQKIAGQNRVVLSAGTDGRDGNSPASGAVADGQTIARASALGLDPAHYLAQSDSYYFFRTLGDTLDTGFTGNNVRDVRVWLDFGSQ
jgi:glycerate 2-kinase